MNTPRSIAPIVLLALLPVAACEQKNEPAPANRDTSRSSSTRDATRAVPAPNNTANNKGDGAPEAKTPMDQSQSGTDVKITADIRRAIMDDSAMSTNAQNCKIITEKSGMVTLRGVVNSQAEKDSIEAKAKSIAGVTSVDNQLEVKPV